MHTKQIGRVAVVVFTLALSACAGVGTATGKYVDDSVITTKVKTELIRDPLTDAFKINVTTVKGVVYLTGLVKSEKERQRAGELARQVDGAKLVKNELTVE